MNNIEIFRPEFSPQRRNPAQVEIIANYDRMTPDAKAFRFGKQGSIWVACKLVLMASSGEKTEQSENLRLPPTPTHLRIDMQNLQPTALIASVCCHASPLTRVPT